MVSPHLHKKDKSKIKKIYAVDYAGGLLIQDGPMYGDTPFLDAEHYPDDYVENGEKVTTAYNETYGKGIDPEKIGGLIACLDDTLQNINAQDMEAKFPESYPKFMQLAKMSRLIKLEDK